MSSDKRPLRLLSLDGGGIRGLSIIYILQDIMRRVNRGRSKEEQLEPWQYFDMIGGTSTGGIIAIMLGCLKMSLEDCESAYIDLSKEIFTPRKSNYRFIERGVDFVNAAGKFDAQVLENAIKKIIERHSASSEVELLSNAEPECKVFVCAMHSTKFDSVSVTLRSYKNDSETDLFSKKFKLWQACRATSAASTFFDPLELEDGSTRSSFIDGGLKHNNPVKVVFKEARDVWGLERPLVLISAGTGDAPSGQFHGSLEKVVQGLAKIATDTEQAAEEFYANWKSLPQLTGYCRLNVPSMAMIGLEEYKSCGAIQGATQRYLNNGETKTKLEQCVKDLAETEQQGQTAHLNDADLTKIVDFARDLYERSVKYGDINRVPQHSRNTCEWFLEHPNFARWRKSTEASALWVTADAGCGKSVLARFLIGHLAEGHKVIHFFFRHSQYNKNNLLCAVLHQLLEFVMNSPGAKSSTMLQMLRDELKYKKGEHVMDEDEKLWKIICNATTTGARLASSKLFCIIDGLDECEEQPRSELIKLIVSYFSSSDNARQPHQPPNFLITSRPYAEIEDQFRPVSRIRLRLENETFAISNDIETMISDRIQKLDPECFPEKMRKDLHTEISQKAGRTFLWVKLIFDALEQLDSTTREEVRKLLDTSPTELNSLYETSLSATKNKEKTRKLLQILIVATRPLELMEVNVALQIQETDLIPNIERAIKCFCGSVLRITGSTVDFMHQTAKEFLMASQYTPQLSQNLTWEASIDVGKSHCVLGTICLWYLAMMDWEEKQVQRTNRKGFAIECHGNTTVQNTTKASFCFYDYAVRNWSHHSEKVLQKAKRAHEADIDTTDPDFRQFQALLTSLRKSGMDTIRRYTRTWDDPFIFLGKEGFHSLVDWFLTGTRIEGYPDSQVLAVICQASNHGKGPLVWPLVQYATTAIGDSEQYSTTQKNEMFSHIANAAAAQCLIPIVEHLQQKAEITLSDSDLSNGMHTAAKFSDHSSMVKLINWGAKDRHADSFLASLKHFSKTFPGPSNQQYCNQKIHLLLLRTQDYRNAPELFARIYPNIFARYRFDQEDRSAEQTEIFECFLQHLWDMPLYIYVYALVQAIRWRHPSVSFLIRSRVDLICATNEDDEHNREDYPRTRTHWGLHEIFSVACRYGDPAAYLLFEYFYPAIDVNRADVFGMIPLCAAIRAGDYSLCEWLLRKNATVNVGPYFRPRYGQSEERPGNLRSPLTKFLKFQDIFPSLQTKNGIWTNYCPDIPEVGLKYGVRPFKGCPLAEALQVQNLQIFKLLLEYGGDPWQDYETGSSVLVAAASHSEDFLDQFVGLIRATNDIGPIEIDRPEERSRNTPLYLAVKNRLWNLVVKLT